jgi:hypothetical protein
MWSYRHAERFLNHGKTACTFGRSSVWPVNMLALCRYLGAVSVMLDASKRLISQGHGQTLFLHSICRAGDWSESHTLPHRDQTPA